MQSSDLRTRRERMRLSRPEVARLAGLPEQRIAELEAGVGGPLLVDELYRLGTALAFEPQRWRRGLDADDPRRTIARFLADDDARLHALDIRLLARAAELARMGASIAQLLDRRDWPIERQRQVTAIARGRSLWRQGYDLGAAARLGLAAEKQPLPSMVRLLEAIGVHVATVPFVTDAIVAVSLNETGGIPMILLNEKASRVARPASRRAVLAHELCHLLHDGTARHELVTLISWEADRAPVEQRANGFAPAFLAPPAWIRLRASEARGKVVELAETWGFTFGGAVWHAKNTRRISSAVAEELRRTPIDVPLAPHFEQAPERLDPSRATDWTSPLGRGLIGDLALEALDADAISAGLARAVLTWH